MYCKKSDTNKLINKLKGKVTDDNITFFSKFDLEVQIFFKTLPIMYWLPKMHKTTTGARLIVASRKCSINALSKALKLFFKKIQCFHEKSHL